MEEVYICDGFREGSGHGKDGKDSKMVKNLMVKQGRSQKN